MIVIAALAFAVQSSLPSPASTVWSNGKESLVSFAIGDRVTNGHRPLQWNYLVKEPIGSVLGRLKAKIDVGQENSALSPERLVTRGQVFIQRKLGDRHQTIVLKVGRFAIKKSGANIDLVQDHDQEYTTIGVTESALMGKGVPSDWPAKAKVEYALPTLSSIDVESFRNKPENWVSSMTPVGAAQIWASYVDKRKYAEIEAELDRELATELKWTRSGKFPSLTYRPGPGSKSGIVSVTLDGPGASKAPAGCTVAVSYVDLKKTWKPPTHEWAFPVRS
jgi:hypothetical protein